MVWCCFEHDDFCYYHIIQPSLSSCNNSNRHHRSSFLHPQKKKNRQLMSLAQSPHLAHHHSLFDHFVIYHFERGINEFSSRANVLYHFPETLPVQLFDQFTSFCFADNLLLHSTPPTTTGSRLNLNLNLNGNSNNQSLTFCFVLTNGDASKRFGFCRRFLTHGSTAKCLMFVSCQ
jgi:hypothetical protein